MFTFTEKLICVCSIIGVFVLFNQMEKAASETSIIPDALSASLGVNNWKDACFKELQQSVEYGELNEDEQLDVDNYAVSNIENAAQVIVTSCPIQAYFLVGDLAFSSGKLQYLRGSVGVIDTLLSLSTKEKKLSTCKKAVQFQYSYCPQVFSKYTSLQVEPVRLK